ncbi:hypothetical protein [Pantoea sp. A4]|uniref:hypothetical protein n=1 Tax=Pantoea sp. A4 TaxID=1225184 RepID=UPI000374FCD1|nr:hypothetical protein [Pantoea sp. A4]
MKALLQELRQQVLAQPDLRHMLTLARAYGALCQAADSDIYDDAPLEQTLIEKACAQLMPPQPAVNPGACLHIISEAFIIGGHTRLMEKLAQMQPEKSDLLVTRSIDEQAAARCAAVFQQVYQLNTTDPVSQLLHISERVAGYQRVVLHIHADDIATVVAVGLVKAALPLQVWFVNHADHAFTYGSAIADFYFQLSSFGARLDKQKQIAGQTSFLGIPVNDSAVDTAPERKPLTEALRFVASGSAIKFRPFRGEDIRPLIRQILQQWPKATFTLIGANPRNNFWWWGLKLRFGQRLQLRRYIPYEQYMAFMQQTDFFIDSHPFPGGTAFAEQILAGRRGIGLIAKVQGYSPADKLKRGSVAEVLDTVKDYQDAGIIEEIIAVNGYQAVKERYLACLFSNKADPFNMEERVAWQGDTTFLRVRNVIFTPLNMTAMKTLFSYNKKIALKVFMRLSILNKAHLIKVWIKD